MSRLAVLLLAISVSFHAGADTVAAPPEHRRGAEQTFLTYPEWFLVHSPAEYAEYVKERTPTDFPFLGHIGQFWQGYRSVNDAIKRDYPFNFGYHVMVMVIGVSTTVEYAIRAAYETLIGRLSALSARHGLTAEDRFAARVAQDYVDFIRVKPWYDYDFLGRLRELWSKTGWWGPDAFRKWERKYALTTEYGIKAGYGWLIRLGTKASYDEPLPVTAVVVDRVPPGMEQRWSELKVVGQTPDGSTLILVPRYEAFMRYASELAGNGARFVEIAGNRSVILVTLLTPRTFSLRDDERPLFEQPILTQPDTKRVAVVVPVASLGDFLNGLGARGARLEHIYDY